MKEFILFSPTRFCPKGQLETQRTNSTFVFFPTHRQILKKQKSYFSQCLTVYNQILNMTLEHYIDDRIKWIVDNLTEIFLACNVEEILKNYGKTTKMEDPIIHFYEIFLSEKILKV